MKAKPYKLIFALLISSVLFVFILQGFWIRNFYLQKKDTFNKTIYAALEQVSIKLNERQNIRAAKEKIGINRQVTKMSLKSPVLSTTKPGTTHSQVRNTKKESPEIKVMELDSLKKSMGNIVISDSMVMIRKGPLMAGPKPGAKKGTKKRDEVDVLVDKMLFEIKIIDTDERNGDTIKSVIKRVFDNKGLFVPFEFAIKKVYKNKDENVVKSKYFDDKAKSFITDLSANKIFSTHNYLFVQCPTETDFVFSSMKNIFLLSLVFSVIIIWVFYFTLKLIIKQKKLSEVKNDFVNNMTHELKTPIATISLAVDAINNPQIKNNEERFSNYTRILKEENQKLNSHVERVLQMALLDKGELQLHKTQINLVSLVQSAIKGYVMQIQKKGAVINFTTSNEVILINADELHLTNVFSNLIDNALKYSSNDCVITIHISRINDGVKVRFKDNGIGIVANLNEKVFEKFYRVQGGNLHDVKGFGLGLSYVRSIIDAHNGSIELKSEKGAGTEFIIKLRSNEA